MVRTHCREVKHVSFTRESNQFRNCGKGKTHEEQLPRREKDQIAIQVLGRDKRRRSIKLLKKDTEQKLNRAIRDQIILKNPATRQALEAMRTSDNPDLQILATAFEFGDVSIPELNLLSNQERIWAEQLRGEQNPFNDPAFAEVRDILDRIQIDTNDISEAFARFKPEDVPPAPAPTGVFPEMDIIEGAEIEPEEEQLTEEDIANIFDQPDVELEDAFTILEETPNLSDKLKQRVGTYAFLLDGSSTPEKPYKISKQTRKRVADLIGLDNFKYALLEFKRFIDRTLEEQQSASAPAGVFPVVSGTTKEAIESALAETLEEDF